MQTQKENRGFVSLNRRYVVRLRAAVLAIMVTGFAVGHAAHATTADPANSVNNFLGGITTIAKNAAPAIAVIAFIALGIMYMGAAIPGISDWKKDNPKAANQVVMGILFVLVSSGAAALLLP